MTADFIFCNGRLVNVYSGEILNWDLAVAGERIIYVGPDPAGGGVGRGNRTQVIDLAGDFLLPGYFDAHAHADLFYNPAAFAGQVLTGGTTGFFNDGHDLASALGAEAYLEIMSGLARSPLSVYTGVPAAAPPYPEVEGEELWSRAELEAALERDFVLGLSEVTPYLRLVRGDESLSRKLDLARRAGKRIEGHTTGANEARLNRLALAGVSSCHESLNAEDVLRRVRLGYHVMLRQGSIRQDLPRLIEAVNQLEHFDLSRLMLVSDGVFADHLLDWGYLDWIVGQAVELGLEPVKAVQMASLNPARYFNLDHLLGGLAPGRLAHLQVVEDLGRPWPRLVMAKGRIAARDGRLVIPELAPPKAGLGSRPFRLGRLSAEDFRLAEGPGRKSAPAIRIVDRTVTDLEEVKLEVAAGLIRPRGELLLASFFSRDGARVGRGLVAGFCPNLGGLASSVAHETHGLLVLGQDEADMALAAGEVLDMGGGLALVQAGRVRARLSLPLGGVCSLEPVPVLAGQIKAFHQSLRELGCDLDYPLWTLGFLTFTSVMRARLTYQGVFDLKTKTIIFP